MKSVYERPLMNVELFMANQAVSTCTVESGITWKFDCMKDLGTIDVTNVISAQIPTDGSCGLSVGYANGIYTARDYDSNGTHSDHNPDIATWDPTGKDSVGSYLQVTYSGCEGLLYTDQNGDKVNQEYWSQNGGFVKHSGHNGGHHLVAPVMSTQSINASW